MQMQENAKLQRQLMELEHDKFVNNQTNQELAAIQELVERKDRDEKAERKVFVPESELRTIFKFQDAVKLVNFVRRVFACYQQVDLLGNAHSGF